MVEKLYKFQRTPQTTFKSEVWLSKKAVKEVEELLDLYYDKHELSVPFSFSQLCTIGLMMLGSLSVSELENVLKWYKMGGY